MLLSQAFAGADVEGRNADEDQSCRYKYDVQHEGLYIFRFPVSREAPGSAPPCADFSPQFRRPRERQGKPSTVARYGFAQELNQKENHERKSRGPNPHENVCCHSDLFRPSPTARRSPTVLSRPQKLAKEG